MNKEEFLSELKTRLSTVVNEEECQKIVDYYTYYIDEGMEYQKEEEVINEIGSLDELVTKIKESSDIESLYHGNYKLVVEVEDFNIQLVHGSEEVVDVPDEFVSLFEVDDADEHLVIKQIQKVPTYNSNNTTIYIEYPAEKIQREYLTTQNSYIQVEGEASVEEARYKTSNAHIDVSHLSGNLRAETSNGAVEIESCSGITLQCTSKNAKMNVINSSYSNAELTTSNAKIEIDEGNYDSIDALTSNAKIEVKGLSKDYMIDYSTSNDKVKLYGKKMPSNTGSFGEGNKHMVLETTNAKIEVK